MSSRTPLPTAVCQSCAGKGKLPHGFMMETCLDCGGSGIEKQPQRMSPLSKPGVPDQATNMYDRESDASFMKRFGRKLVGGDHMASPAIEESADSNIVRRNKSRSKATLPSYAGVAVISEEVPAWVNRVMCDYPHIKEIGLSPAQYAALVTNRGYPPTVATAIVETVEGTIIVYKAPKSEL